ncbi:MAG TPA: LysR family transcriptional regulator [Xanthobacteraceae bacterium]|nr:LysR family transcriptional regulator [Xanthobacteraceae bacterium]
MPQPIMEWESRIGRRVRLRDLYILTTVVDTGSMAKAATRLSMSQPSISEAIANLETALRVRLLDRSPRGVEPTSYADALMRRGRIVFDELNQGVRDIQFMADPAVGEVRIGCPENLAAGFVPAVIAEVSRQYPRITFQVLPVEPVAMRFRELRDRSVDLMVGRVLHPPLDEDLSADILFDDRLLVVAGRSSPWARRRSVAIGDLLGEQWVDTPANTPVSAFVVGQLRALGITLPQPVVQTYSMHVRNRLLSTGRFLGLMWASALAFNQDGWSFKALPVRLDIPTRPVAIITLKNRTLSPAVELFVKQALETARSTKSRRSLAREAAC